MKRKLSIIIAMSAALTMLAACGSANESETEQPITEESVSEAESASASTETESETVQETTTVTATEAPTVTTKETTTAATEETTESETVTTTEETTIVTETTTEETTITYKSFEMPLAYEHIEGDSDSNFYATTDLRLGSIDSNFAEQIGGWGEFEEWIDGRSSINSELTAVDELANLYSLIKDFEIPDDTVRELLINHRVMLQSIGSPDDYFTDEDIDILLSDDPEKIAQHFASEYAICKGKNLYSLKWIYYHSVEDYIANGITADEVKNAAKQMESCPLTDEARAALTEKVNYYSSLNENG